MDITQKKLHGIASIDFWDINLISVLLFRTKKFAKSPFAEDWDLKIANILVTCRGMWLIKLKRKPSFVANTASVTLSHFLDCNLFVLLYRSICFRFSYLNFLNFGFKIECSVERLLSGIFIHTLTKIV